MRVDVGGEHVVLLDTSQQVALPDVPTQEQVEDLGSQCRRVAFPAGDQGRRHVGARVQGRCRLQAGGVRKKEGGGEGQGSGAQGSGQARPSLKNFGIGHAVGHATRGVSVRGESG